MNGPVVSGTHKLTSSTDMALELWRIANLSPVRSLSDLKPIDSSDGGSLVATSHAPAVTTTTTAATATSIATAGVPRSARGADEAPLVVAEIPVTPDNDDEAIFLPTRKILRVLASAPGYGTPKPAIDSAGRPTRGAARRRSMDEMTVAAAQDIILPENDDSPILLPVRKPVRIFARSNIDGEVDEAHKRLARQIAEAAKRRAALRRRFARGPSNTIMRLRAAKRSAVSVGKVVSVSKKHRRIVRKRHRNWTAAVFESSK